MGTRSLTFIHDGGNDDRVIVNIYRQYDGYPSGHGNDLIKILKDMTIVNGLGIKDNRKIANGVGCLATQVVAHLKDSPGSIHLEPADSTDCGQDYEYHVYADTFAPEKGIRIECKSYGNTLFDGSVDHFEVFCNRED